MSTELKFKGFWDPSKIYLEDDIVEYYNNIPTDSAKPYGSVTTYKFLGSSERGICPLANFNLPVQGGIVVELTAQEMEDVVLGNGKWNANRFYDINLWTGPHGSTINNSALTEINTITDSNGNKTGWEKPHNISKSFPFNVTLCPTPWRVKVFE